VNPLIAITYDRDYGFFGLVLGERKIPGVMVLVNLVKTVAEPKGATPAQVALAWLLEHKQWIVPIPGTTKLHRFKENPGAVNVGLTEANLKEIDEASSSLKLKGARLLEAMFEDDRTLKAISK